MRVSPCLPGEKSPGYRVAPDQSGLERKRSEKLSLTQSDRHQVPVTYRRQPICLSQLHLPACQLGRL